MQRRLTDAARILKLEADARAREMELKTQLARLTKQRDDALEYTNTRIRYNTHIVLSDDEE